MVQGQPWGFPCLQAWEKKVYSKARWGVARLEENRRGQDLGGLGRRYFKVSYGKRSLRTAC